MPVTKTIVVQAKGVGYSDYAKAIADALAGTTLSVSIVGDVVTANVNILSQSVVLNINISSQSAFNININIAAAAAAVTLNINIKSQTGNVNVNIAANAVVLNVNLSSQTGNVSVNIAASAATVSISVTAQTIGVNLIGDWAAQQATDINVMAHDVFGFVGDLITATYVVPGGKTLYVTLVFCGVHDSSDNNLRMCTLDLRDDTLSLTLINTGGNGGVAISLNKPIRFATGHSVQVSVHAAGKWPTNAVPNNTGDVGFLGYLTTP
jgi:hypothetical protein